MQERSNFSGCYGVVGVSDGGYCHEGYAQQQHFVEGVAAFGHEGGHEGSDDDQHFQVRHDDHEALQEAAAFWPGAVCGDGEVAVGAEEFPAIQMG